MRITLEEKLDKLVDEMSVDLVPALNVIENRANNQDERTSEYTYFLSYFDKKSYRQIVAVALLQAGAEKEALIQALKNLDFNMGEIMLD